MGNICILTWQAKSGKVHVVLLVSLVTTLVYYVYNENVAWCLGNIQGTFDL